MARLSDSVAPEVQTISLGSAPISAATFARASSTASSACQPKACEREAGLPNSPSSVRYWHILSATRGSTGVGAAESRYIGFFIAAPKALLDKSLEPPMTTD